MKKEKKAEEKLEKKSPQAVKPEVKYELPQVKKESSERELKEEVKQPPVEESPVQKSHQEPEEKPQEEQTPGIAAPSEEQISENIDEPSVWTPEEEEKSGSRKLIFIILIIIVLVLGLIAGGVFVYKNALKGTKEVPEPTPVPPSPTPTMTTEEFTPSPTASPSAEIKRGDFKIQVLNGSGVAGVAGRALEFLEGLGYKDIEVGNADSYDYEETEVSIKEEKKDYLDLLLKDLEKEYTLSTKTAALDEGSDFDAVIIIGKK